MPQSFILPERPEGIEVPALLPDAVAQLLAAEEDVDRMSSVLRRVAESQDKLVSPDDTRYAKLSAQLADAFETARAVETEARDTTRGIVAPLLTQLELRRLQVVEVDELVARFGDACMYKTTRLCYETYEVFRQNEATALVRLNGCLVDDHGVEHRKVEANVLLRPGSYVRVLQR